MDWKQVTISTTTAGAEIVSEIFMEAGASGTAIEDRAEVEAQRHMPGGWDYIDDNVLANMSADVKVTAWYPMDGRLADTLAFIRQRLTDIKTMDLGFDTGSLYLETDNVRDEDWENNWKRYYKPFAVGDRLLVKPVWEAADARGRAVLEMEPGMAFGTGTHETTFMCLEMIEKYVRPGMLVWDVGCGTGILAVAAVLLGAAKAAAVDRDPVAVQAAGNNAALNRMEGRVEARGGDLMKGLEGAPELIVSNIVAEVIIPMAPEAYERLGPNGIFVCSGIILSREEAVREALDKAGFELLETKRMGEWVAIAARKSPQPPDGGLPPS
jgi:ribosomal protein L11 methyltransferase